MTLPRVRPSDPARVRMHVASVNDHHLIVASVPGWLPVLYRMDNRTGELRFLERSGTVGKLKRIAPACVPPEPPRRPGDPRLVRRP